MYIILYISTVDLTIYDYCYMTRRSSCAPGGTQSDKSQM